MPSGCAYRDNSPYVVCFGARSAMKLLEQRGGQLFRGRRPWRTSGGMNRGRGYARGFTNRGRWNGVRGACGGRGRGFVRGRGNGRGKSTRSHQFMEGSHDGGFNETEQCNDDEEMEILTSGSKGVQVKCPVIGNVSFVGDSFALRMCKANDANVTGKFMLCEGGLTMNEMKSRLEKCDANDFKTENIVMFMGMNDLRKLKINDYDGEMFSLLSKVKEVCSDCRFYICTLPMLPGEIGKCIMHFNKIVHLMTSFDNSICKIDLESVFVVNDSIDMKYYEKVKKGDIPDIHPNVEGLKRIYELISKTVV